LIIYFARWSIIFEAFFLKDMVQKLWLKHCAWLKENLNECFESLNPPAREEDLLKFQSHAGYELPDELKQLYLLNNGQNPDCFTGVWWGLAFIPLNHLVEYHLSKNTPILYKFVQRFKKLVTALQIIYPNRSINHF
jgi:hypothetical protein